MLEILETLGIDAFEIIITAFVGYVSWKLKKLDDKKDKEKEEKKELEKKTLAEQKSKDELSLGMARVMLIDKMQKSLDRGFTTQADYEVVDALYKPYIECGGNGVVKHLFEDRYNILKVKEHE